MPRIKAGALCSCGNAEAPATYALEQRYCIPKWEKYRCSSSWVLDAREREQFCFTEGNYQCYRNKDCENLLICEKGVTERLSSGKVYAFAGRSVYHHCPEPKKHQPQYKGQGRAPITFTSKHARATGDSAVLQTPGTCTVSGRHNTTLILRNWKTYNQPQADDITVAGFVSSYFKIVMQI